MTLSIRTKLTGLLVITGLLPVLAALALLVGQGGQLRRERVAADFQASAEAKAATMRAALTKEIREILALTRERAWADAAGEARTDLPPDRIRSIDARWPILGRNAPEVKAVLDHPLSASLRQFRRTRADCREIFLTDRQGLVIAASDKTSDYVQSDEAWWVAAVNDGEGTIYVSPAAYDESTAGWSIDICVPIHAEGNPAEPIVGVCKAVMDLRTWVAQSAATESAAPGQSLLLRDDGTILAGRTGEPGQQRLTDWADDGTPGWTVVGGKLRARAMIELGDRIGTTPLTAPRWHVAVEQDAASALGDVRRLAGYVLAIGLAIIAVAFAAGLFIAHRTIGRPLGRLRKATERIAAGEFALRVNESPRGDEIDRLTADFNEMVAAVEQSHAALTAAGETKSRFIRVAGHELRTPITYILGMTALLAGQIDDAKSQAALAKVREKARRLDEIITEMLKLADTGQIATVLTYSHTPLAELVGDVAAELQPFAAGRNLQIVSEVAAVPAAVRADRAKLHDALSNLVSNAIKFTPDGGTITISTEGLLGGRVAVRVADQGEGIPEDELPHIFEPFWGGRDVLKHSSGVFGYGKRGCGLGLAIARQFARLHGGHIQVENAPTGCVFSLIIPIEPIRYDATGESANR